jgi:hypothetical protein
VIDKRGRPVPDYPVPGVRVGNTQQTGTAAKMGFHANVAVSENHIDEYIAAGPGRRCKGNREHSGREREVFSHDEYPSPSRREI